MGIYDKKIEFNFAGVTKQAMPFAIAIIAVVLLIFLFGIFSELTKQQAIEASFSENPLDLSRGDSLTKLSVTITNITSKNAANAVVEVAPENPTAIIVFPEKAELGLVEKGNKRITEFNIRTNPSKQAIAGTYTLNIFVVMNGDRFQKQVVLEIKTK